MTAAAGGDYSRLNKLLLIAGLLYFLWPQIKQSFGALGVQVPDLSRLLPAPASSVTGLQFAGGGVPAPAPPGGGPGGGGGLGAIAGGVTRAVGAASAAGAGALAIGIASGVGAVAAILAWGILEKGWFRGGEEGTVVNPARDQYLAQFAPLDYMRDSRNPPGFFGLAWLLEQLAPGQGSPGGAFEQLTGAHKKDQLVAAVNTITGIISVHRDKAVQLWEYARRDSAAPQRAVTAAA